MFLNFSECLERNSEYWAAFNLHKHTPTQNSKDLNSRPWKTCGIEREWLASCIILASTLIEKSETQRSHGLRHSYCFKCVLQYIVGWHSIFGVCQLKNWERWLHENKHSNQHFVHFRKDKIPTKWKSIW